MDADILKPELRYGLKGKIISEGFWTLTEFSGAAGVNLPIISRIVSGREIPGAKHQKRIADTLGISLRELGELLNADKKVA
jgi:transcriptional regulator with XRE-family HTH domain